MLITVPSQQIFGLDDQNIDTDSLEQPLHVAVVEPLGHLKANAAKHGFELTIASGYRGFEQQLTIWNNKARGVRVVLDDNERPIDLHTLSDLEKVWAILRWTALPGASRHHWGSDFDVYDRAAISNGYQLQLTVKETLADGIFAPFYAWLDGELMQESSNFFRPYAIDRGGVAPEPWHLSHKALAKDCLVSIKVEDYVRLIQHRDMELKSVVLKHIEEIFDRFVFNIK